MQLFLFLSPGILLFLLKGFRRKSLTIELLIYVIGSSLAFFVVAPWFIKYLNIPLTIFAQFVFLFSCLIILLRFKKLSIENFKMDQNETILLLIFILVVLARCLPIFLQIAPAGADMSMHSYIARLIHDHNGIPGSYYPIADFGAYPAGFPILSATMSLLSNVPVYRSGLFVSCLTHALICFALYVFLLRFFDRNTAAAASIATSFLTRSPQWIIRWGGNPTVLALFFFIVGFTLIIEAKENFSWLKTALSSLFLSATLITHPIVFYTGAILLAVYFALHTKDIGRIATTGLCIFLFTALFLFPYLLNFKFTLSSTAVVYAKSWQGVDFKSVVYDLAAGLPFLILSLAGLPILLKEKRGPAIVFLSLAAVVLILIANYRFWLIPFSCLLYPGRVALFLIIPLALFICPTLAKLLASPKRYIIVTLLIVGFIFYGIFYVYNSVSMCSVTQADLDTFLWMDKNISKEAVIVNNYGDAGLWIPAIAGRGITHPHSFAVFYESPDSPLPKAKYVYIGKKQVYPDVEFKSKNLEQEPDKYTMLYNENGAQLWKIKK